MNFLIHLDHAPTPADCGIHPGLDGYLAILHDGELEKTVYVGFLAPHGLLPKDPGPFQGMMRLLAWLARGVAIHDQEVNHDTVQWLARALQQPAGLRPVIVMRNLPEADEVTWPISPSLADLQALAEADLVAMDLQASVDAANTDEPESATRF